MKNAWNPMEERNKAGQKKKRYARGWLAVTPRLAQMLLSSHSFGLD